MHSWYKQSRCNQINFRINRNGKPIVVKLLNETVSTFFVITGPRFSQWEILTFFAVFLDKSLIQKSTISIKNAPTIHRNNEKKNSIFPRATPRWLARPTLGNWCKQIGVEKENLWCPFAPQPRVMMMAVSLGWFD